MIQTDLSSFSYKKGSLLPVCKKCGTENFHKNGKNKQGIQRYQCRNCGFRFVWTFDLPRRNFFSSIMGFAVNHVHFSANAPKRYSVEDVEIMLKSRSAKRIFEEHPGFRKRYPRGSFWSQYEHHQSTGHKDKDEAESILETN